jgi:hypothetical protein
VAPFLDLLPNWLLPSRTTKVIAIFNFYSLRNKRQNIQSNLFHLEFNSVLNRLADMTTANVDSMEVHHSTWTSQIKDVIDYYHFQIAGTILHDTIFFNDSQAMNVNGGDIENATTSDYVMHFLTFGWKV